MQTRGMTPAGRRRVSLAMKRRWAERRAKAVSPKPAAPLGRQESRLQIIRPRTMSHMVFKRGEAVCGELLILAEGDDGVQTC